MNKHLMVDFETLDTKATAKVLSFGAVMFNEQGLGAGYYTKFDLTTQKTRTLSMDTVKWWFNQSSEARRVLQGSTEDVSVRQFIDDFTSWLVARWTPDDLTKLHVWSNGGDFDIPILVDLFDETNYQYPFKFWNHRCFRTVKSILPVGKPAPAAHHALSDAKAQAEYLVKAHSHHGRIL